MMAVCRGLGRYKTSSMKKWMRYTTVRQKKREVLFISTEFDAEMVCAK